MKVVRSTNASDDEWFGQLKASMAASIADLPPQDFFLVVIKELVADANRVPILSAGAQIPALDVGQRPFTGVAH